MALIEIWNEDREPQQEQYSSSTKGKFSILPKGVVRFGTALAVLSIVNAGCIPGLRDPSKDPTPEPTPTITPFPTQMSIADQLATQAALAPPTATPYPVQTVSFYIPPEGTPTITPIPTDTPTPTNTPEPQYNHYECADGTKADVLVGTPFSCPAPPAQVVVQQAPAAASAPQAPRFSEPPQVAVIKPTETPVPPEQSPREQILEAPQPPSEPLKIIVEGYLDDPNNPATLKLPGIYSEVKIVGESKDLSQAAVIDLDTPSDRVQLNQARMTIQDDEGNDVSVPVTFQEGAYLATAGDPSDPNSFTDWIPFQVTNHPAVVEQPTEEPPATQSVQQPAQSNPTPISDHPLPLHKIDAGKKLDPSDIAIGAKNCATNRQSLLDYSLFLVNSGLHIGLSNFGQVEIDTLASIVKKNPNELDSSDYENMKRIYEQSHRFVNTYVCT